MNNARCKSVALTLFLLLSSIQHIYAADNDPVSVDIHQQATLAGETPKDASINDMPANAQPCNIQEPSTATQPSSEFFISAPSSDDEQAMRDALAQGLNDIPADGNIQQLLNKATNEMLEKYNEYTMEQLRRLDCILEEVAVNLSSNNLIPTRNRGAALQKVQALRMPLYYLQNANIVPLNENVIFAILKQIQEIADYTYNNLEQGIDQCEPYDMAQSKPCLLDKATDAEQQLQNAIIENNKTLEKLRAKAERAGLHVYNIAWRWMHKKIFDPWQKHSLTKFSLLSVWATSTAFLTWYYFGSQTIPGLPAHFGHWLRDKVGWPAQSHDDYIINDAHSALSANQYIIEELEKGMRGSSWYKSGLSAKEINAILEEAGRKIQSGPEANIKAALNKPVGWLGRLEHRIAQFTSGKFVVGSMLLAPAGEALLGTIAPNVYVWLSNNIRKADNFLLGGTYRNKRIDDFVLHSSVTFADVIGCEDAKKYGREVIEYLKNPESWERSHIAPKTGILLFGETRTGKSFWIDAFYGELVKELGPQAGFKLWPISYQLILEKGIEWVLDAAREFAPCIIVIEEIDLLGLQRTENRERLASFMTALNSCLQQNTIDKTVIVIGTTNKLENIELALRQRGRLGEHFLFKIPEYTERKQYIEEELNKLAVMIEQFDIALLARLTEGCSYERISSMIKGALTAAKIDREAISQQSLERSLERYIYGISLVPCKLDDKQKRIIATHLAGEIVATQLLDDDLQIAKATIKNVSAKIEEQSVYLHYYESAKQNPIDYGKIFYCHNHDILPLNSKADKINQCKIYRAGHIAESIVLGASSDYHPTDRQRAYEFTLAVAGEGLDMTKLPPSGQNQFFDLAYKMVAQYEAEIRTLLEQHKDEINAIADLLIQKQTIGKEEIDTILPKQNTSAA